MSNRDKTVFRAPCRGDVIEVDGDRYEVIGIERHPDKPLVRVRINGQENRLRNITMASWRGYEDDATVLVNTGIVDAFD